LSTFSLRTVAEIDELVGRHLEAPQRRLAQRSLADEMVALVHGPDAAVAAAEAADLLFAADPTTASADAFQMLADELPFSRLSEADLADDIGVFVATGLASSKGDARRTRSQRAYYANGQQLDENSQLSALPLLHGQYLLLRKGKKSHHLVEVFS
jgi:tyrosyl-tRNA synthetase